MREEKGLRRRGKEYCTNQKRRESKKGQAEEKEALVERVSDLRKNAVILLILGKLTLQDRQELSR